MREIFRGEMCEGRNVPLDSRGAKYVWGETWDNHSEQTNTIIDAPGENFWSESFSFRSAV